MRAATSPARTSLRLRLALSYAGIALLSVAVLGATLVGVLGRYFRQAEDDYLRAVAVRASGEMARAPVAAQDLERVAAILALTSQTRVRFIDSGGQVLADSGLPTDIDPETLAPPIRGLQGNDRRRRLPSPLGSGPFGLGQSASAERSDRVLSVPMAGQGGAAPGTLLLSDGPASGRHVLTSVVQALSVSAFIAMVLAASAGYLLSARIAHPLVELTEASDRMAEGDLSSRSAVTGDDEVGRLAFSFNTMADRIEATVMTLRRFVADAAHEIGTPLTALQADLELAEAAQTPDDERTFVRRALTQARRIEDLSSNLLRLSRLEAGEVQPAHDSVDVAGLVAHVADAVASRAEQAEVALSVHLPEEPVRVIGHAEGLRLVVENLLDNALKFTPEGGRVEVGVETSGAHASVWVADSGIGIPSAEHDEVFSRFFRARNVAAYPGSGLGLAIVLATVEQHGGTVGFRSGGTGTRFDVRLPLA